MLRNPLDDFEVPWPDEASDESKFWKVVEIIGVCMVAGATGTAAGLLLFLLLLIFGIIP